MRPIVFHPKAQDEIRRFPKEVRARLGRGCFGCRWVNPSACRMLDPTVSSGVSELRVTGEDGVFRVFYFTASPKRVLAIHAFAKKTQRTPPLEIELARKRLKELLDA